MEKEQHSLKAGTYVKTLVLCSQRHFQSLGGQAFSWGSVDSRQASTILSIAVDFVDVLQSSQIQSRNDTYFCAAQL